MAWAALILIVSSTPATSLPETGFSDKLEHAGAYLVLAILTMRALPPASGSRDALVALVAMVAFAAIDEWHQRFIPGRYPDSLDWVADSVGVVVGVGVAGVTRHQLRRQAARNAL